jgi:hypothetical protein
LSETNHLVSSIMTMTSTTIACFMPCGISWWPGGDVAGKQWIHTDGDV